MEEEKENKIFKEILEWCICIFIAIIIALLTRYYIGTPTAVKQTSMYPTLKENQRLWISRTNRITKKEYKKGDIVTFEAPSEIQGIIDLSNPVAIYNYKPEAITEKLIYNVLELNKTSYIKRIIATEGDTVEITEGKVYINGKQIQEPYLPEGTTTEAENYNNISVPKGHVFVMGDNRAGSIDSRTFGCIPIEKIEGKVVLRYWPFSEFNKI